MSELFKVKPHELFNSLTEFAICDNLLVTKHDPKTLLYLQCILQKKRQEIWKQKLKFILFYELFPGIRYFLPVKIVFKFCF